MRLQGPGDIGRLSLSVAPIVCRQIKCYLLIVSFENQTVLNKCHSAAIPQPVLASDQRPKQEQGGEDTASAIPSTDL